MSKYDGIIFDLDGTLWNTDRIVTAAWNQAIEKSGFEVNPLKLEDMARSMGKTVEEIRKMFFPHIPDNDSRQLIEDCLEQEVVFLNRQTPQFYPQVREGIIRIQEKLPIFLVSNCETSYLEIFWMKSNLKEYFEDWECHGSTGLPKWENIKDICQRNKLHSAPYVGDTSGDQRAAEQAGVEFWFVTYGFGSADSYQKSFNNFPEIVDYLTT